MKKTLLLGLSMIFFVCLFPFTSFGNNTTDVRINVHEIKVNCDTNGSFIVNEKVYNEPKSLFVAEEATISMTVIPKNGYVIERIECDTEYDFNFENNKLVIGNIVDDINVKIIFKPNSNSFFSDNVKFDENVKNENQEIIIYVGCIILFVCILITLFYIIRKRKNSANNIKR